MPHSWSSEEGLEDQCFLTKKMGQGGPKKKPKSKMSANTSKWKTTLKRHDGGFLFFG